MAGCSRGNQSTREAEDASNRVRIEQTLFKAGGMGPRLRAWVGAIFLFSIYLAFLSISVDSQTAQEIRGFAPARVEAELQEIVEAKVATVSPNGEKRSVRRSSSAFAGTGFDWQQSVKEYMAKKGKE